MDSAISASSSGPGASSISDHSSDGNVLTGFSGRDRRAGSSSRQIRATIVVSQPPRFSTSVEPARATRNHVSWMASSASSYEPSIR